MGANPRFDCADALNRALAAVDDPEYVALALVEGIKPQAADAVARSLQCLRDGLVDEAKLLARRAADLLAREYMEGTNGTA